MDDTEFRSLVKRMRDKQKEYFRTRDTTVLRESKDLERRVDEALTPEFPKLFDEGGEQ